MLIIKNVDMSLNKKSILNDINLNIEKGVYGLLGENGAGKTTLMRLLTTIYNPSRGEISIDGLKYNKCNEEKIKKIIGYLPQELGLYPNLTVMETLNYLGGLHEIPKKDREDVITNLLSLTNLTEHKDKKYRNLSGGMKRRVGLAQALINDPKLLIVDEPTAGLDPEERIRIRNLLSDIGKKRLVVFSTHVIEDIAATCDNVCILRNGVVRYNGKVNQLIKKAENHCFTCTVSSEQELNDIKANGSITGKIHLEKKIEVRFVAKCCPQIKCSPINPSLEDAYIYLNSN